MKTYVCRYYYDGKWWSLDLRAEDPWDAEARVMRLGSLQLLGELKMSIPVKYRSPIVQFFVMSWCSIANFCQKLKS